MSRFIILDCTTHEAKEESKKRIGKMLDEMPPTEYIGEIKKNRNIRSITANAFFHVVCQIVSIHTGHTLQEVKDDFKRERYFEIKVDKQGRHYKHLKETAGLDTMQYAAVCNNLLEWVRDKFPEITIERREDVTYKRWLEINDEYEKVFSGF